MRNILIVEDEPDIQELLCAYLQEAGYGTAVAGDGVAALDLFQSRAFDLVLLDLMLPKIDGFGVCEVIRRQSQVPILMLTALDGEEQQLRGFGLDIDDYVTKPFSMPVLLEKIRVILRRGGCSPGRCCWPSSGATTSTGTNGWWTATSKTSATSWGGTTLIL